jgi:hypothetical protein
LFMFAWFIFSSNLFFPFICGSIHALIEKIGRLIRQR